MARCSRDDCGRWRPDVLVRHGAGLSVDGALVLLAPRASSGWRGGACSASRPRGRRHARPCRRCGSACCCGTTARSRRAISSAALDAQRQTRLTLGAELRRAWALADAASDRCARSRRRPASATSRRVDPACVRDAPGGLSPRRGPRAGRRARSASRERRPHLASPAARRCRARRSAALRQLTGWTPEPFLVGDADLERAARRPTARRAGAAAARPRRIRRRAARLSDAAARDRRGRRQRAARSR